MSGNLKGRVEKLEQLMAGRDDAGTWADSLREMMPGAEVFESELAGVAMDVGLAVTKRLGIKSLPDAADRDQEIVCRAIELAVKDQATRILRGDHTPPPAYFDEGPGSEHADRQALDRLIARASKT